MDSEPKNRKRTLQGVNDMQIIFYKVSEAHPKQMAHRMIDFWQKIGNSIYKKKTETVSRVLGQRDHLSGNHSNGDLACEDIMFSREKSPGISLVLIW